MKKFITILISLLLGIISNAQTKIVVESEKYVYKDEQFNVNFIINAKVSDFKWDVGEDFNLVWGPQKGEQKSISIINGKYSSTVKTTYTYILKAKKTGLFTLPLARAKYEGKDIESEPFTIQVLDASSSQTEEKTNATNAQKTTAVDSDEKMFLLVNIDKTKLVLGEAVNVDIKLYTNTTNISDVDMPKFPSFNGFWSQEAYTPNKLQWEREPYKGKLYNVIRIRSYTLIPQQLGDLEIEPITLSCRILRRSDDDIFSVFGVASEYERKLLKSKAQIVKVSALPSPVPIDFGAGVGQFSLSDKLDKDTLTIHEAASLLISIEGKGNISLLDAPIVNFPKSFEKYDVKESQQLTANVTVGKKIFEYPFIPRAEGEYVIPAVTYSYYDVSTNSYIRLRGAEHKIVVLKDSTATSASVYNNYDKKDKVNDLAKDIRYIIRNNDNKYISFIIKDKIYYIYLLVLFILSIIAYFALNRIYSNTADVVLLRNKIATKMAKRRLKKAFDYLQNDNKQLFYENLHRAMLDYAADKLNLKSEELSKENIAYQFIDKSIDGPLIDRYIILLEKCEEARYAPNNHDIQMNLDYDEAENIIVAIDKGLKDHYNNFGV